MPEPASDERKENCSGCTPASEPVPSPFMARDRSHHSQVGLRAANPPALNPFRPTRGRPPHRAPGTSCHSKCRKSRVTAPPRPGPCRSLLGRGEPGKTGRFCPFCLRDFLCFWPLRLEDLGDFARFSAPQPASLARRGGPRLPSVGSGRSPSGRRFNPRRTVHWPSSSAPPPAPRAACLPPATASTPHRSRQAAASRSRARRAGLDRSGRWPCRSGPRHTPMDTA